MDLQIKDQPFPYKGDVRDLTIWKQIIDDQIKKRGILFQAILVDPPWRNTGLKFDYNTLSYDEISSMPI